MLIALTRCGKKSAAYCVNTSASSRPGRSMFMLQTIDIKNVFLRFLLFFIKNTFFNVFYYWKCFLFSSGEILYRAKHAKILLNLPNSCIKRLLSDGFNM